MNYSPDHSDRILAHVRNFLKARHPDVVISRMSLNHEHSLIGGEGDLFILTYPCTRAKAEELECYTVDFKCNYDQYFWVDGMRYLIGDGDDSLSVQYDKVRRQVRIWIRTWYTDTFQNPKKD